MTFPNNTQNAQELVAKMRKIIGDPQEWWEPSRATRLLDVATELSERLKPSDTQTDTSDQELENKMKRLYKENPPLNDTSELDAQLDEILAAHWQVTRSELKEPLAALIAQREQAAELRGRIDELKGLVNEPDRSFTIRGCQAGRCTSVEDRLKKLQATKPEKGTEE